MIARTPMNASHSAPREPPLLGLHGLALAPRPILDDITVVIPTLGRPILATSLRHIAEGSAWPAQVIVVDQGSSHEVAAMIAALREAGLAAEHLPSTQRGRAAGVNRGIERAMTRFVAITDDDCFVEREWLQQLAAHLRARPEAIVTGRVEQAGNEVVALLRTSREAAILTRPLLRYDSICGGNMAMAKAVLGRIGLLDEDPVLRTAEDGELSYRALSSGVPVVYAPDAGVCHYGWRDEGQRAAQYRSYGLSQGGFYGKYLRRGDWFIALRVLVHLLRALRRWVRGRIVGDSEAARIGRAYVTGLIPGIVAGRRSR
jgi:GT2 family glycosyltransferase